MFVFRLFLTLFVTGVLFAPRVVAQRVAIDGYVVNAVSGKHLSDVNIYEKKSGIGTISDQNGYFKLILRPGEVDISFKENNFLSIDKKFVVKQDTTLLSVELNLKKNIAQPVAEDSGTLASITKIFKKHK